MAYDFGTNTLGIQNPFKPEGWVKSITGGVLCVLGLAQLLGVSADLQQDMVLGWLHAGLGVVLLVWGMRLLALGLYQLFRYFVGRSVPTSLAQNFNPSELENAELEKPALHYSAEDIESMLMGRKNSTFAEPGGWIGRLIHSLFPSLLFMPFPVRNYVQELGGVVAASLVAIAAFGLAYFVAVSGLAGAAGDIVTPIISLVLLVYLTLLWWRAAGSVDAAQNFKLRTKDATGLAKLVGLAVLIPVAIGFGYSQLEPQTANQIKSVLDQSLVFNAWTNLGILLLISLVVIGASWVLVGERFQLADPTTEVSEFRENLQESVHPNEIFINIENIVLANRRFKEIPNRIYRAFDPVLQEQSQGKGSFKGQLLIETQPEFLPMEYSALFQTSRLASTVIAQLMVLVGVFVLIALVNSGYELYSFASVNSASLLERAGAGTTTEFGDRLATSLTLLFSFIALVAGGKLLSRGTFLFWSEMHFSSLLMWMKTEGTFTESKISTGMSIHDSTRSENVVVRSSITPWIVTSRVVTSTYADSGMQNLERPRFIMTMRKNGAEMERIVAEIKSFLRNREAIASITNEGDLGNAETIYKVNEASRAFVYGMGKDDAKLLDEQAAGKRIQDQESGDAAS